MIKKPGGLGRGLDALIATSAKVADISDNNVLEIDVNKIEPNREQPRKRFDEGSLNELAESLKEYGMIQPVIVRAEDGYYTLIAGERRWRAARIAKMSAIPAIVRDYNPVEALQIALIENIQRTDLNPIEEALCYKRLIDEFFYTQESLSQKIGKSRYVISNTLSLLGLSPHVQNMLVEGELTSAHGRALLALDDADAQAALAERAAEQGMSAREIERIIKGGAKAPRVIKQPPPEYVYIENELKSLFGTRVRIQTGKSGGKIEIEYYNAPELERLIGLFKSIDSDNYSGN